MNNKAALIQNYSAFAHSDSVHVPLKHTSVYYVSALGNWELPGTQTGEMVQPLGKNMQFVHRAQSKQ